MPNQRKRTKRVQTTIYAEHKTRTFADGVPAVKEFTLAAWAAIPMSYFIDKNGVHKEERQGWVQKAAPVPAPTPLKKAEAVKPEPVKTEVKAEPVTEAK